MQEEGNSMSLKSTDPTETGGSTPLSSTLFAQHRLTRRQFMHIFGISATGLAATSLLAACGGDDDDDDDDDSGSGGESPTATSAAESPTATTDDSGGSGGEQRQGGHLRVGQSGEPDTLDMHRTESSTTWEVGWSLYDTLIIADEALELWPALAESWEASDDGLTFTFALREDVIFHDGTPFNAEAMKWNLDRVVDPATGSLYAKPDLGPYESSEALDEFTLQVNMTSPYGFLIRAMSLMEFGILSPSVGDMAVEDVGQQPISSGPFKFKEWVLQDHITLERNEDYNWGSSPPYNHSGPPFVDEISWHVISDAPTRVAALEAGEMDVITRTPGTEVERLEGDGFKILKGLQTGLPTGFIVNTNKFPTNELAVRRAINLGLDRQQISDGLYAGQEEPGFCLTTPTTWAHWDCTGEIYYDPDEAQAILEEAGWEKSGDFYERDGEKLVLDVYVFGSGGPIGEAFQAAIRPVGIDVNLQVVPFSEQKITGFEGRHNMMVGRFDAPDPKIIGLLFHSENIGETGFTWTHLNESDPDMQQKVDELLDAGLAEVDPEARAQIYRDLQQLISENHMFVAMKYDAMMIAMKPEVEGIVMNDMGFQIRTYDAHFTDG